MGLDDKASGLTVHLVGIQQSLELIPQQSLVIPDEHFFARLLELRSQLLCIPRNDFYSGACCSGH